jgi:hypothetical protein
MIFALPLCVSTMSSSNASCILCNLAIVSSFCRCGRENKWPSFVMKLSVPRAVFVLNASPATNRLLEIYFAFHASVDTRCNGGRSTGGREKCIESARRSMQSSCAVPCRPTFRGGIVDNCNVRRSIFCFTKWWVVKQE